MKPAAVLTESEGVVARIGAAQRLLDITDLRLRTQLALRYQLMTEQTNLFLVHERAALEKAGGVPALQQIGNMMAAGGGGMGTVSASFDSVVDLRFCRRHSSAPDAFEPLQSPAVWRRQPKGTKRSAQDNQSPRTYSSFAEAVIFSDEFDNPIGQLLDELKSARGSREPCGVYSPN